MIAALYVMEDGPYSELRDVEAWGVTRDARLYPGPWPVVAHPPCKRWGRYWSGGPSASYKRKLGDDGGCFTAALASVRKFGGVLEHPEASHAWSAHGLNKPPFHGGWVVADMEGGWTCCVAQGHYGHRARKATWLYANKVNPLPSLHWGMSGQWERMDEGFSAEQRRAVAAQDGWTPRKRISGKERLATPEPFKELLLSMARSVTLDAKDKEAAMAQVSLF